MNRTPLPPPCVPLALRVRTRLPVSQAGIASLWGYSPQPYHKQLKCCKISSVKHIPEFVRRAKDKNDSFRLMGFGHRVYKNYDPRATVMRETCHEVLKEWAPKMTCWKWLWSWKTSR